MSEVEDYLRSKGVRLLPGTGDNQRTHCMFHGEDPGSRGRLYINTGADEKTAGLYMCHVCGERGNFTTLRRHFGDTVDTKADTASQTTAVLNAAATYYANVIDSAATTFLQEERGLSAETIAKHQLGFAPGGSVLLQALHGKFPFEDITATGLVVQRGGKWQDFLQQQVTIPYHTNGMVVSIRGREIGGKYVTPPGTKARLFNADTVINADQVILTEGEFDALVLEQLGFHAVGIPGASTFQAGWANYFSDARRVFIMFDPDAAGRAGTTRTAEIIGPKAKPVELPVPAGLDAKDADPSYFVARENWTKADFDSVLSQAAKTGSFLISVHEAIEEWETLDKTKGLTFGWEAFDAAIKPGLLPGQIMVPLSKTNTGKTLMMLNMMQSVAMEKPDAKMLFITLEQTRADWWERARRIWYFHNPWDPASKSWDKLGDFGQASLHRWINIEGRKFWQDRIYLIDRNRLNGEQVDQALQEFRETTGQVPDLVVVDYLGYFALGVNGNGRYEQTSNAIMALKAIAKQWRVPIITPHQVNRSAEFGTHFSIDQARDAGVVEETADLAISMWRPDDARGNDQARNGLLEVQIGKSRHGGKGDKFDFKFGSLSLVIRPREDKLHAGWIDHENVWRVHGLDWDEAIFSHHVGVKPRFGIRSVS